MPHALVSALDGFYAVPLLGDAAALVEARPISISFNETPSTKDAHLEGIALGGKQYGLGVNLRDPDA